MFIYVYIYIYLYIYTQPGQCMPSDWTLDLSQDSSMPLHDTYLPLGLHSAADAAARGGCGAKFAFSQPFVTTDRNAGGKQNATEGADRTLLARTPHVCTREINGQREHTRQQESARVRAHAC
jgi:hypothetical protein